MEYAAIAGIILAAIPAIKSLFEQGLDPNSEEFRSKAAAMGVDPRKLDAVVTDAKQQVQKSFAESAGVSAEQAQLAAALKAQAEGKTPSLAQMQYERALEASQAAAASQLASARGMSPAAAQRLLLNQQAAARSAAAGQSAQLRLQEQAQTQGLLGNILGQQRQQALLGGQLATGYYGTAGDIALRQGQMEQQAKFGAMGQSMGQQQQERQSSGQLLQTAVAGLSPFLQQSPKQSSKGGEIKGRSAFKGDTRSNDTVPAMLSPGEIVLPRSVAQSEDAPEKSKKFVEAIKAKKKPTPRDYMQAISRLNELESRLNAMETLMDLEAEES